MCEYSRLGSGYHSPPTNGMPSANLYITISFTLHNYNTFCNQAYKTGQNFKKKSEIIQIIYNR